MIATASPSVPIPGVLHGTESAYAAGCKCGRCLGSRRVKRKLRKIYGPRLIDGAEALAHVKELERQGFTPKIIATVANVEQRTLMDLRAGQRRLSRDKVERLLAVDRRKILAEGPDGAQIPRHGTVRRIHALMRMGWSQSSLTTGVQEYKRLTQVTKHPDDETRMTTLGTYRWVCELYDRHAMIPGPSTTGAKQAATRGLHPPLAWDDDTIDDPDAVPMADVQPAPRPRSKGRGQVLREDIKEMRSYGVPPARVCEQLGITASHAEKLLRDSGDTELSRPFNTLAKSERQRSAA